MQTSTEKYYYIRDNVKSNPDGNGRPIITVCLLKIADDIGRGIAICSDQDIPCKKVGRAIAKTRAIYALAKEKDSCEIGRWDLENIQLVAENFGFNGYFKSFFDPDLTNYERKLFDNKRIEQSGG